jgi:nitrogen fixation NifU-like protein
VIYSDKVMDHFNNPRNVGVLENADGVGEVGNPVCGDMMKITIAVNEADRIEDVKFQTLGCGAAIATSSIVTEMAKGLLLEEAAAISKQQVADELGGLPPAKMHCSVLATDGLKVAVDDYLKKHGREPLAGEIKSADPNFDPHADEDDHAHDAPDHQHDTAGEGGECSVCCQRP